MIHTLEECAKQFPIFSYIKVLKNGAFYLYDARKQEWYEKPFHKNEIMKCIGYRNLFNHFIPVVEMNDYTHAPFNRIWDNMDKIVIEGVM